MSGLCWVSIYISQAKGREYTCNAKVRQDYFVGVLHQGFLDLIDVV